MTYYFELIEAGYLPEQIEECPRAPKRDARCPCETAGYQKECGLCSTPGGESKSVDKE